MDPNTGKLYPSLEAALMDGVKNPVLLTTTPQNARRISSAVQQLHAIEKHEKWLKKKAKKKAAKHARKKNR